MGHKAHNFPCSGIITQIARHRHRKISVHIGRRAENSFVNVQWLAVARHLVSACPVAPCSTTGVSPLSLVSAFRGLRWTLRVRVRPPERPSKRYANVVLHPPCAAGFALVVGGCGACLCGQHVGQKPKTCGAGFFCMELIRKGRGVWGGPTKGRSFKLASAKFWVKIFFFGWVGLRAIRRPPPLINKA